MPFTKNLPVNRAAFLDMIAWSEIGAELLVKSDNGYNVVVGSTPELPRLFPSYADHPRIFHKALDSTAAGRYQIIEHEFDAYKARLGLQDFSPASQDSIALQMIRERGAFCDIDAGNLSEAISKVSGIWASLPGNGAGQHQQKMADLIDAYKNAGGSLEA